MNIKQLVLGISIILLGAVLFLANVDFGPTREILGHWWPVLFIAAGAYNWWSNPKNFTWSLTLIAIGIILLIRTLDIVSINISAFILPAILVGVGASILANGRQKTSNNLSSKAQIAILGGSSSRDLSEDYKSGSATAILGGVELDLRKAIIKKEASLNVTVVMGGVELRVAENVVVKNQTASILGGFEDKTTPTTESSSPILYINGTVLMGGVEIKR